jgi:hypothetical protein
VGPAPLPPLPPRSPNARDRGHPQLDKLRLRSGPPAHPGRLWPRIVIEVDSASSYTGPNHRFQVWLIRIDSNRMGASQPLPVFEPNRDLGVTITATGAVVSLKG